MAASQAAAAAKDIGMWKMGGGDSDDEGADVDNVASKFQDNMSFKGKSKKKPT